MNRILIIDADECVRETLTIMLEKEKYVPLVACDAEAGCEMALAHAPALIIADFSLPGTNGIELCKRLTFSSCPAPMIVLSAIGDELEKVLFLEIGADDYVVKPFSTRELLARIRAVLRRRSARIEKVSRFGDVEVDHTRRAATRAGGEVKLTHCEYNLLVFFLQNVDRVVARGELLSSVWGYEPHTNSRTVDSHVVQLRRKLERDPSAPIHLVTIHGRGYRFLTSPKQRDVTFLCAVTA